MPGEVKRAVRVAQRLREEVSWLLTREVRDPRVKGVVVSRVEMPDDLKSARVYVRLLEGGEVTPARTKEALVGLERAAGLLRRQIGMRMNLRYAPELKFFYDEGLDRRARIDALLHEVKKEDAAREK